MNLRFILPVVIACSLMGCRDQNPSKSRGPIVLGDSSTIVTETDPALLQDQVTDLQPVLGAANTEETNDAPPDTALTVAAPASGPEPPAATAPASVRPAAVVDGLNVPFKEVTISIPGIKAKSYGRPDLQRARGASYQLTDGNLAGARLQVSGATVSRVTQRYETIIQLQDGGDRLPLESLGKYTSEWKQLNVSGGAYAVAGLERSRLGYKEAGPAAIRNAVQQAARRQRLNRRDTQDWLDAVRRVRNANQAPATVVLRSVMWRIEGKDAGGRSFNKELRIDVPLP